MTRDCRVCGKPLGEWKLARTDGGALVAAPVKVWLCENPSCNRGVTVEPLEPVATAAP